MPADCDAADSSVEDEELINYHVEEGYGIFDTGATGHAISEHELNRLIDEEPESFSAIDSSRRKVMGLAEAPRHFH